MPMHAREEDYRDAEGRDGIVITPWASLLLLVVRWRPGVDHPILFAATTPCLHLLGWRSYH